MRYIYDQFNNYFGNSSTPIRLVAKLIRPYLKWYDKKSNKNVDLFLANSNFVKDRIERYYQEDSKVVHPFVDLKDFREIQNNPPEKENFYLMVTAFAPNKKVDLAIEAFNELGLPLKIIGSGSIEMTQYLKGLAKSNIEFFGSLKRDQVISSMAKAKGFIFPGVEDFGITPLEVLASGTPIIAYEAGGVLETLNDKTATFFGEMTKEKLIEAVKKTEKKDRDSLIARAEHFSKENFQKKIIKEIKTISPSALI
jgi:glycosyltransferase involved in cell wall biosynthesis